MKKEINPSRKWNFELSEKAQNDVRETWFYISESSLQSADKLLTDLSAKFKLLAQNPNIGKRQDKYLLNLRSFPFKNYIIFYVPTEYGIEIFRVIHGSRDVEGLFDELFENIK